MRSTRRFALAAVAVFLPAAAQGCFESIPDLVVVDGGGAGSGDGGGCAPESLVACYHGPAETEGVGICRAGSAPCANPDDPAVCQGQTLPTVEACATSPEALDDDCNGETNEHCANFAARFGDTAIQGIEALAVYDDGDLLVSGRNTGKIDLGGTTLTATGTEAFVARLGPEGEHRWSRAISGTNTTTARTVASTGADAYVGGAFKQSVSVGGKSATSNDSNFAIWVARLTDIGTTWLRSYGGSGSRLSDLASTSDGAVVFVGALGEAADFGVAGTVVPQGGLDALVAKISSAGTPVWARGFGAAGPDEAVHLAADAAGDIYVTGSFSATADFGCPIGEHESEGSTDAFVAKLSGTDGSCVWSRAFGGPGDAIGTAIAVGDGLHVLIRFTDSLSDGDTSWESEGDEDTLLAVLDPASGEVQRARAFGGPGKQSAWDAAVGPGGELAVAFSINGSVDFGGGTIDVAEVGAEVDDAAVALFDADGEHVWSRRFGGDDDDDAIRVRFDDGGALWVGGEFTGTIDLGTGPMLSEVTDAYLMRLTP